MHTAANSLRGGVSPRGALLRGQSIIEYVLIIAVIGLVIVFAGPGVAGAIRNQFNLVGNTVNNGTVGGTEGGGWEKSELRTKMNSGEIWNLMPADFQSKVKAVSKLTNNVGGGSANKNAAVIATSDKLFLLSYSEIVPTSHWASSHPWTSSEGTQYEAFKGKVTNNYSGNDCLKIGGYWWERSANPYNSHNFLIVYSGGDPSGNNGATVSYCVCPAWCF